MPPVVVPIERPRASVRQDASSYVWTTDVTKRVADPQCDCWGQGILKALDGETVPCACALRGIYRVVFSRFQQAALDQAGSFRGIVRNGQSWARTREDFILDFELCARRALTPAQHQLFKLHLFHVLCCEGATVSRYSEAPVMQKIESTLGRAFAEIALWPLDHYFGTPPKPKSRRRTRRKQKPALAV